MTFELLHHNYNCSVHVTAIKQGAVEMTVRTKRRETGRSAKMTPVHINLFLCVLPHDMHTYALPVASHSKVNTRT